ncbi:fibrinogen-like protein A [Anopheles merus]|uniref:fibrinogen-like protein A n=1 Tax=Anopheles merus TaxID=30066 RepID=UPI001BE4C2A2|nr:fibrinogen-like protein A [Anopheles merus]
MCVSKVIMPLLLVLFLSQTSRGDNHHNVKGRNESSFAYELIAKQLEYLEQKLDEMESAMKEDRKLIDLQTRSNRALTEALNANNTHMRKEMQLLASKNDLARYMTISGLDFQSISFESCKENLSKRSGKYLIQPTENDEPFLGYCAQTAFGGGWLVIQYRYDGSVDFFRNWTEYRNGFGNMCREFWLGLEHLHRVTSARKHELMVELKDFDGNYIYARYDEFAIGSEAEQYPLTKLGSYTGTAGDALNYHKDMKFSTVDRDNDVSTTHCARYWKGAWWYKGCHNSNLNGIYKNSVEGENIVWNTYKRYWGLAYSRMMIRETK